MILLSNESSWLGHILNKAIGGNSNNNSHNNDTATLYLLVTFYILGFRPSKLWHCVV